MQREAARDCEKRYEEADSPGWATASASHSPLLKIPVWWRRAVLPSLPWVVCFLSFFLSRESGTVLERMAFKRHFARVGAAERCTESIFTDHQRQVCDYALVYAEKKNDGEAPYSVSFTATQNGNVIVQLHPHLQLERAVRHARAAGSAGGSSAARAAPAAAAPIMDPVSSTRTRSRRAAAGPHASRALPRRTRRPPSGLPPPTRPATTPIYRTRCSKRLYARSAARSA